MGKRGARQRCDERPALGFAAAPGGVNFLGEWSEGPAQAPFTKASEEVPAGRMKILIAERHENHGGAGVAFDETQKVGLFDAVARHQMSHRQFRENAGAEAKIGGGEGEIEVLASGEIAAGAAEEFAAGIGADGVGITPGHGRAHAEAGTGGRRSVVERLIRPAVERGAMDGALGVPSWLLLPHLPDWRWLLGRPGTPWYPHMRLFRQASPGDWQSVLQSVRAQLANQVW